MPFEHFLKNNQHKNDKTIWEYNWFFKKFTEHFSKDMPCMGISKIGVEEWLLGIKSLIEYRQNTIHTLGKQCVHFLNFLFEYNYCQMFIVNSEIKTKPEVVEKVVFSDSDIKFLFKNVESARSCIKMLVYLAFYTGLRPSDIYLIKIEDIDLKERTLRYYEQKLRKHRVIPFHNDLGKILKQYIGGKTSGRLLPWREYNYLGKAITRYFAEINYDSKGYSARTFRKTFITLARSKYSMDATVVRELVGHEHMNTADRYYNEISIETMRSELKKFKRPK
jgi:integrase